MAYVQTIPVVLSLGSNLGDRKANLEEAAAGLPPQVQIRGKSALYETEPWGYQDQPNFLNQVLLADTRLSAAELLIFTQELEAQIGRVPNFRYGPRLVDIDIIFYGEEIIQEPNLEIPHPRFRERAFVLVPLAEICPDLLVPGTDLTVSDLAAKLDTTGVQLYRE